MIQSLWQRAFQPLSYLWRLRSVVRRYRRHLIGLGLLGTAASLQPMITPQVTREIIDVAYPARDFHLFFLLTAFIVGLNLITAVIESLATYLSTYVNNLITFRIRMKVFHALNRVPVSYVESHHSGMFLERIAGDADQTSGMLSAIVPQVISLLLTTVLTLVMMANISSLVTVLVLAIIPLYYVTSSILALKLRVWQQRMRMKDEQLTTGAIEAIQGVPTARIFGIGNWLRKLYTGLLRDKIKMSFGIWRVQLIYGRMSWAVSYFWGILLTFGGWYLVFQDRLTLGDAVALGMYIPLLLRPAQQLLGLYQSLIASSVPAQRVTEVLDEARKTNMVSAHDGFRLTEGVRLQGVRFAYRDNAWCLNNISLDLKFGETVVIVGATGSGKTTLMRLLAGMFDTYEGDILADGIPLSSIRTSSYQANVAMVMADNFFFSGSIMENMRMAGPNIDQSQVRETAKILALDKWLESLPNGYDTRLGVGGIRLSSGQTQKIAVLRALLKKPRLLLLDELTSAMDVESERRILDGLQVLRPAANMTILTTHRLALTREPWVNKIVVLDDGAIVEQGSIDELYVRNGEYRRLMELAGLGRLN
ncbi:MAG: ABC transporter ATP-binding protein [candidate division Zixibacteria bacterium]|nr:ABC transporter ATP-binding protein [candidate division Zixibacteria bacterium]